MTGHSSLTLQKLLHSANLSAGDIAMTNAQLAASGTPLHERLGVGCRVGDSVEAVGDVVGKAVGDVVGADDMGAPVVGDVVGADEVGVADVGATVTPHTPQIRAHACCTGS